MPEPKRISDVNSLVPYVRDRVLAILAAMRAEGFDPVVFEAKRSEERQRWLYAYGRTRSKGKKPITWTLNSRHLVGKAADIISKSRGWNDPTFFHALAEAAIAEGMHTIAQEACHVQYG